MKPKDITNEEYLNDYWKLRESYMADLKHDRELRKENRKRIAVYILRKLLWSFGFFPIFLAVWIPLLLSHFNLVVFSQQLIELFTSFLAQSPNLQAATSESIFIAWASIGCMFMVFDLVLTPYRSPFEEQADAYMKARYMMFSEIMDSKKKPTGAIHTSDQEVADHDMRPVYKCEDDIDEEMITSSHISIGSSAISKKHIKEASTSTTSADTLVHKPAH
ncbi:hypothetical protein ACFOEK_11890 [Litoribrevibacter euphylliae]|uniref:Uncharacterized protein n=1 Tax=Litoribrevibacter euphylliae TaxID=1834034 RepID=A0ABV7HHX6_9GAMM